MRLDTERIDDNVAMTIRLRVPASMRHAMLAPYTTVKLLAAGVANTQLNPCRHTSATV
jgi:hypothetical protein